MSLKNTEHLISVAITNTENLLETLPCIEKILLEHFTFFEILIIQHNAAEEQIKKVTQALSTVKNGRCIMINNSVSYEQSLQIFIEKSIGDFILFVNPTTDDVTLIPQLIQQTADGKDYVAVEHAPAQGNIIYFAAAYLFHAFIYILTGVMVPQCSSSYSCINRKLASALQQGNRCLYIKLFARQFGYCVGTIPTQKTTPKLSLSLLLNKFRTALEIVSESSARLISFASLLSLACCIANALYLLYVSAVHLFVPTVQAGWTTTSLLLASMFAAIFFVLFAIGMVCTSVLKQNAKHQHNMVAQELGSSDNVFNFNKLNVERD